MAEEGCSAVQPERLTAFHWGIPCRHRLLLCVVRSPNASNSNNVRNVNSDGTLNNNNAYNGNNGVRPASVEFTATK